MGNKKDKDLTRTLDKDEFQKEEALREEELSEARQATDEARQKRHEEMVQRREELARRRAENADNLKKMLAGDVEEMTKTDKTRGLEMIAVFAKHNFYAGGLTPVELRTTLEDLGPTYVKIGQIMSSRVDMLPKSYCKELESLRANVKELDPAISRAVIEQETGKTIDEIYDEFRDEPLGSASIGQVHYGVLKDGTKVVTKVQRPMIAEMMRKDFALLRKMAGLVNIVNEGKDDTSELVDLLSVIEEMEKVEDEELDFRVEAENTRFFKENCIDDEDKISCPTVIDELTTERIFTMTFVDGYSIAKKDRMIEDGCDPDAIGAVILDSYIHQVLDVGTFHADPHQGNIMISGGKPVWIDFGMLGRITDADINLIQSLILALIDQDMEKLVTSVMNMGAASPLTDRSKLTEDADAMFEIYMSVSTLNDLDLSVLLEEITDLASKHHISMPGKYTMLVRSVATIEGVMEQLCPDLNLFQMITDKLLERARRNFDVKQELISAGKDVLSIGKKAAEVPKVAYDLLENASKGRMKMNMELTGYEPMMDRIGELAKNLVLALFACVLFFGSCILCTADIFPQTPNGLPLVAAIGLLFSVALGIYTVKRMWKK